MSIRKTLDLKNQRQTITPKLTASHDSFISNLALIAEVHCAIHDSCSCKGYLSVYTLSLATMSWTAMPHPRSWSRRNTSCRRSPPATPRGKCARGRPAQRRPEPRPSPSAWRQNRTAQRAAILPARSRLRPQAGAHASGQGGPDPSSFASPPNSSLLRYRRFVTSCSAGVLRMRGLPRLFPESGYVDDRRRR